MSNPFLGEIRMFAGNFAPRGWAFCSGQILAISQNDALFALLGTTYGGDGQVTFALPDFRGRIPIEQGQGPGLSPRTLGEQGGTETVTLISTQMPAHSHTLSVTSAAATAVTPGNTLLPGAISGDTFYVNNIAGNTMAPLSAAMLGPSGGSQPHLNMMPTLVVNFIIALEGVFPSRN